MDTSIWSLIHRRDQPADDERLVFLTDRLRRGHPVHTTGLVLQELLQGFRGPRDRDVIIEGFRSLRTIRPHHDDHIEAAGVRNACRRGGVQIGTVDALLAAVCINRGLTLLTADHDFRHLARHAPLALWAPEPPGDRPAVRSGG